MLLIIGFLVAISPFVFWGSVVILFKISEIPFINRWTARSVERTHEAYRQFHGIKPGSPEDPAMKTWRFRSDMEKCMDEERYKPKVS